MFGIIFGVIKSTGLFNATHLQPINTFCCPCSFSWEGNSKRIDLNEGSRGPGVQDSSDMLKNWENILILKPQPLPDKIDTHHHHQHGTDLVNPFPMSQPAQVCESRNQEKRRNGAKTETEHETRSG